MKTLKKSLLVIFLLLCVTGGSFAAYGLFWATSNSVHVDVQYGVTLSTFSVVNSEITLNAAVTNNGQPVGAGISVDFYYSLNGAAWTSFATQPTDSGGVAQAKYTVTTNGGYDFQAIAYIP